MSMRIKRIDAKHEIAVCGTVCPERPFSDGGTLDAPFAVKPPSQIK
jgi:hypothetical protein